EGGVAGRVVRAAAASAADDGFASHGLVLWFARAAVGRTERSEFRRFASPTRTRHRRRFDANPRNSLRPVRPTGSRSALLSLKPDAEDLAHLGGTGRVAIRGAVAEAVPVRIVEVDDVDRGNADLL